MYQKNKCEIIGQFESVTKTFYVYKTIHKGEEITFCQAPLGGAGAVQIMEQLIASGINEIIATGCCGALVEDAEGDFLQPLVVESGVYVLTSSIAGIVEKSKVIDGSAIEEGDIVLAIASNGLHTNGYSLVRLLMDKMPQIKLDKIDGLTFIEQIMKPHTPYYKAIKGLFEILWSQSH